MALAPAEEKLAQACESLDHLALQLMTDLETLQEKREALNGLIEKGWLSLSQSRYSMGNKCVSSLQYGQDMVPSALVHDSAAQNGGTQFHIERRESEKREEPPEVEEIRAAEQVLRRRKGPRSEGLAAGSEGLAAGSEGLAAGSEGLAAGSEGLAAGSEGLAAGSEGLAAGSEGLAAGSEGLAAGSEGLSEGRERYRGVQSPAPPQDPLHWFGILVPQSLRQAQSNFRQGISLAAEVASLQNRIGDTHRQYRSILRKKRQLLARED